LCPISELKTNIAGVIYVDNTDIIHFQMDKTEDVADAHFHLQSSINNWGKLLIATGGSLKPEKCFFYLVSFTWTPDGTCKYDSNKNNDKFRVTVPKWDGSAARIDHHGVNHASKTLGSMTCPSGCNRGATLAIQEKSEAWAATVKEGKLSRRNVWFMMENQVWPRVAFGTGVSMASFDTLL